MAIKTVSLPSAAGVNYGKGDVRHFSPGDAVDVPSLQNPTRHLAQRDNELADKVNEIIGVVNNQEQFVPIAVVRTLLAPSEELTVYNYRIPAGFESRVVNAAISATPTSTDIELKVYFATGYGAATGLEVISTATEFSGGVSFYNNGEFIIALKNKSGASLELAASLLLTLRPLGAEGSLLAASVVRGDQGDPGPTGSPGPQGLPGSGGEGSPGMVWKGPYDGVTPYYPKEVVSFPLYGSLPSSFIATSFIPAGSLTPGTAYLTGNSTWQVVALGASGPTGSPGPQGVSGTNAASYYNSFTTGSFVTGADWVTGEDFYPTLFPGASVVYPLNFQQAAVLNSDSNGLAFLFNTVQTCFSGHGTLYLPQRFNSARCDFAAANVQVVATANGTQNVYTQMSGFFGTSPTVLVRATDDGTGFVLTVLDQTPIAVNVSLFGAQQVVP